MKTLVHTFLQATALLLAAVLGGCSDGPQPPTNDPASLRREIGVMIALLGSDKHEDIKGFIKKYANPKHLAQALKDEKESLDEFAKKFGRSQKLRMLKVLKYVADKEPILLDDKVTYTFELPDGYGFRGAINFLWDAANSTFYIKDK